MTSTAVSVSSAPTSPKGSSGLCRASLRRRCTAASPWAWRRGVRSASPRATSTTSSASGRTGVSAKDSRGRRTPRRVRSTAGWTQTSHSSRRWEHTVIRQHRCSIGCVASLVGGDAIGNSFMIYSLFWRVLFIFVVVILMIIMNILTCKCMYLQNCHVCFLLRNSFFFSSFSFSFFPFFLNIFISF